MIIFYDPEHITPSHILDALQEAGYLAHPTLPQLLLHQAHAAAKAGDLFGKAVFHVFVNKALEGSIASLTTVLF